MKYGHIDENNNLLGWYSQEVHEVIPTPNIEVSEESWSEAININANFYDGTSFVYKEDTSLQAVIAPTKEELMAKLLEIQAKLESM